MNTKYRFLFGLLLLGVIVLFILHNTLSTQARTIPRPQPSPTPEVLPNGWYRYTDKAAGYAISYPSTVRFSISRDAGLEFPKIRLFLPRSTGFANQVATITVYPNPERLLPEQFLLQNIYQRIYRGAMKLPSLPLQEIQSGQNMAYQVDLEPFLPALYIFHKDKVYFLALHMDMLSGTPPTLKAREMFFEIAATFTLLDKDNGR